jgi:hypothetical protein
MEILGLIIVNNKVGDLKMGNLICRYVVEIYIWLLRADF